jgi:hypothetical protein
MPPVLILVALLAQAPGAPGPDPQLERIREAVAETPAISVPAHPDETGRPVFRVKIEAWRFTGHPWDQDATSVPDYVRPSMPLAHYEFLQMVTPQAFRASTLYPGIGFDPVIVKNAFKAVRRAAAERSAREEVRRDFEAYLQARAAADR